jgi:putative endonuclease
LMGMTRHFVYILECSDGTLYTGYTTNIDHRIRQHDAGKGAKFTRSRRPVRLAYKERLASKSDALRREVQIKRMSRSSKLLLLARWSAEAGHSPS